MEQKKSAGPLIGIVIILVVIAVGGFYFSKPKTEVAKEETKIEDNSDELSAIEQSLKDIGAETETSPDLELEIK